MQTQTNLMPIHKSYLREQSHESISQRDAMPPNKQTQTVVGHVGIEVSNLNRSKKFYKTLLEALGFAMIMDDKDGAGFSNQNFQVWLGASQKPRVKRGTPTGEEFVVADHLAILVPDKEIVDAVENAMKENGFKPLFPCEEHPQFEPGYYAVSYCDPDNYVTEIYTRPKPKQV